MTIEKDAEPVDLYMLGGILRFSSNPHHICEAADKLLVECVRLRDENERLRGIIGVKDAELTNLTI